MHVKQFKLVVRKRRTKTASMINNLTRAVKGVTKNTNVTNTTTYPIIIYTKKLMTTIWAINTKKKKTLTLMMNIATTIIIMSTMTKTCMVCFCTF
jgi:hypothetical protein